MVNLKKMELYKQTKLIVIEKLSTFLVCSKNDITNIFVM